MTKGRPFTSIRGTGGLVATADQLATQAGMAMLHAGGNAVDAAIAANAAIAVTGPHLCGMGGDLFALVHTGDPDDPVAALNASGRAGSGVDSGALRAAGRTSMPFRHGGESVTVPGCVDGWLALHHRFGSLPLADVLSPAARLAADGFPAGPLLVGALGSLDDEARPRFSELVGQATRPGSLVRRPGVAAALRAIVEGGRAAYYQGDFGRGVTEVTEGVVSAADLATSQADWVTPLSTEALGVELHTIGPNSQGYLTLAAARLVDHLDLPTDPGDPQWSHLLIEAAAAAGHDRPAVLHDRADGDALLASIDARLDAIDPERASGRTALAGHGDTTYLCTTDADGMGASLIQSNASGFGSWLVEPNTGINLHNRGLGFSLEAGHPAEAMPGRRPPHTLAPALATDHDGGLRAVFGTMGGDAQPQILLQLAVRLFVHGQSPATAIDAARWSLSGPTTGFDTWDGVRPPTVTVEGHAPAEWRTGLAERGHRVTVRPPYDSGFGHAHAIVVEHDAVHAGAADPRTWIGSCAGR